jgi:hypothetical protein
MKSSHRGDFLVDDCFAQLVVRLFAASLLKTQAECPRQPPAGRIAAHTTLFISTWNVPSPLPKTPEHN